MDDHREQHDERRGGEEPLGSGQAGEYRKENEQQRGKAPWPEPHDQAPAAGIEALAGQGQREHRRTEPERQGREQQAGPRDPREPRPDERAAERHEGEEQKHLGGGLAEVEEAVAQLRVRRRDRQTGGKRGQEAAAVCRFAQRICRECKTEGVQRLVVTPHAHPAPHTVEQHDPDESDRHPRPRSDDKQVERRSPPVPRRVATEQRHRAQYDGQQHEIVESALEREHLTRRGRHVAAAQQPTHHHGVGRGERRAEDRRGAGRQPEQPPRRHRDERRRDERAGSQDQADECAVALHLADVHRDRVGEQHQDEAQRRNRLEDLGVEPEIHQPEPEHADDEAEQQEERDLGKPGALDDARQQRGDADEGEGGDIHQWIPPPANCLTRSPSTAFASPNSIQVLSSTYSSLSMPANPGFLLRFTASTVFALSASMMGIP